MLSAMLPNIPIVALTVNSNRENKIYNFKFLRDSGSCHHIIEVNSNRKNTFYTSPGYQPT